MIRGSREQSSSLGPSLSPCWSSGNHSHRLSQKAIEGFDSKINGWAALRHSLGRLQLQAQTQSVSWSVAVAANFNWITIAILILLEILKVYHAL